MIIKFNYLWQIIIIINQTVYYVNSSDHKILSRKRRFLAFPPGSSFSAALCTTIGSIGNPDVNFLSYALNWGVSYNLPNDTWVIQSAHGFNSPVEPNPIEQKKRFRRDLYRNFEVAIDSMGYNGNNCVLRTICESSRYLFSRTGNMIEEIFKLIFNYSGARIDEADYINSDHQYWRAFELGKTKNQLKEEYLNDCSFHYPRCSFSLLELVLGKQSLKTRTKF